MLDWPSCAACGKLTANCEPRQTIFAPSIERKKTEILCHTLVICRLFSPWLLVNGTLFTVGSWDITAPLLNSWMGVDLFLIRKQRQFDILALLLRLVTLYANQNLISSHSDFFRIIGVPITEYDSKLATLKNWASSPSSQPVEILVKQICHRALCGHNINFTLYNKDIALYALST